MKQAITLIEQEIAWCEANKGASGKGEEWEATFLKGLEQALGLLKRGKAFLDEDRGND